MVPGASLPRLAECRDCHEPIRFVQMQATGRALPVNPKPVDGLEAHGTVVARLTGGRLTGFVISAEHRPTPSHRYRFRPHYATCEGRAKKKAPPTPAPDAALF